MKRFTKQIVAVAMALALILSMGTFVFATSTTTATMNGLTMQFGDPNYDATPPESNMRFTANSTGFDVSYENGIANFYPDTLAFYVTDGQSTITDMDGDGITVQPSTKDNDGNIIPSNSWTTGFYILHINTVTSGTKTLTISASGGNVVLTFTVPTFTASTGSKIYAYLPAPGQFTNEGVTTGGWGDAYDSSGNLKNNTATGVSLGAYGGYVVFDMGPITRNASGVYQSGGVENKSTTPYGTDFIIFGNAFWTNAEPGHIQVSQDGTTWFDIAGSKYYDSTDTKKNQTVTYTVPPTNHTEDISYSLSNIETNHGTRVDVSYSGSASGTITTNSFHNHCWFSFNTNYFVARTSTATELSKIDTLPFVSRTLADGVTSTLSFTGLRLDSASTSSGAYQFGYADVHQILTLGGTTSYNPYTPNTSTSTWSTISSGTSGGDPIDISWAVTSTGAPAQLDAVRFIRVYTAAAQMGTPAYMGEMSTEVCGISVCEGTGSGSTSTPTITVANNTVSAVDGDIVNVNSLGSSAVTVSVTGTGNVYINGENVTSKSITPTTTGTKVQVIVQNGNAAPYIAWLNLKK